jgi:hypothetical protein
LAQTVSDIKIAVTVRKTFLIVRKMTEIKRKIAFYPACRNDIVRQEKKYVYIGIKMKNLLVVLLIFAVVSLADASTVFSTGWEDGEINPGGNDKITTLNTIAYPATQPEAVSDDEYGWAMKAFTGNTPSLTIVNTAAHSGSNCVLAKNVNYRSDIPHTIVPNSIYSYTVWYMLNAANDPESDKKFSLRYLIKDQTNGAILTEVAAHDVAVAAYNTWYSETLTWDSTNYAYVGTQVQFRTMCQVGGNAGASGGAYIDDQQVTIVPIIIGSKAWNPTPNIGNLFCWQDVNSLVLKWSAGNNAVFHDVYIGTSLSDVNNASTSNLTGIYRGRQSGTTYNPLPLAQDTVYYWRIDEVTSGGVISKGDVWNFTVGKALRDLYSDSWVANDGLGRSLPTYPDCSGLRSDKLVGIFYFIWHRASAPGPSNVTAIIQAHPFTDPHNPWADNPDFGTQYGQWWAEPEAGFFVATDKWYIRRNISMLTNAGVDVLILDATNAVVYWPEVNALCDAIQEMRFEGNPTPKICFTTHANSPGTVKTLYDNFYATNSNQALWFYWQGKPLMLGYPDGINSDNPRTSVSDTIRNFFTWRGCWAWFLDSNGGITFLDNWSWLDYYPQGFDYHLASDKPEQTPVCIASHPTINLGRSYQNGSQPDYDNYHLPITGTQGQGLYFSQQWRRALELDPNFIFITGWNEWTASWWTNSGAAGSLSFLGRPVPTGGYYFVDAYNQEYSRDAEPMKGGFTDNYYYQMTDGIRKFKGIRPPLTTSAAKSIQIDSNFSDWTDVAPEFRDIIGDTIHRNSLGVGNAGTYINNTGRNDFVNLKVVHDDSYVYFYAETNAAITPYTDPNWMLLFINTDQYPNTGWQGYDYLVNYDGITSTTTSLKRSTGGWSWTTVDNAIPYAVSGNKMELRIPRSELGLSENMVSPIGWWKLDETSGTTASDSSGNGRTGIVAGTAVWASDATRGNCLSFNGTSNYVDATINVSETAYAVSLWFKSSTLTCGIFEAHDGSTGMDRHIALTNGNLTAAVWNWEVINTSGTNYADGQWHNVVHTFGGSIGGQRLYVDGVLKVSGNKSSSDFTTQTKIRIGYSGYAVSKPYFVGSIDDVRIYSDALTPTQALMFDFHWADNIQKNNDIIEFAVSGDSAPDRRFNYRYDTSVGEKACDRIFSGGQGNAMDLNDDCAIDFDDVAIFAAEWLNPYTFTNFANLAKDWLNNYNSANLTAVTLLQDNFEGTLSNWPSTGWDLVTTNYTSPTHSLECGGSGTADGDLISKDLDTHGKASIRISFKRRFSHL